MSVVSAIAVVGAIVIGMFTISGVIVFTLNHAHYLDRIKLRFKKDKTIGEIYELMSDEQKTVVNLLVAIAVERANLKN